MQEESLQTGGQCGFTRTFLSEQVQDGKVTGTLVDHIPEKGGYKVAESNTGILSKDLGQLFDKGTEQHPVVLPVNHQPLELVDFRIVLVNLGSGRNVVRFAVVPTDDAHFVHFMKDLVLVNAVAEGKELLAVIPAQLADALRRIGTGIQEFLYAVQLVNLAQPHIVAQ